MSKYYSGVDGTLRYQDTPVVKVRDWQIQLQTDALETTTLSDADRCYTTGLRSATGSATVLYYDDAPVKLIEQVLQKSVPPSPTISETCKLRLGWDTNYFEFDAVITSASMGMTVGEVMSVNIQFQKTGVMLNQQLKPPAVTTT